MSPSARPSSPRRPFGRRLLRWTAWTLGGLVLLLALLVGFLETGLGRRTLAGLIEELGSTPDQRLEIGTLGGSLFDRLTVDRIALADAEGTWMTLSDVALDWSPGALLSGRLEVTELTAAEVDFARPPLPGPDSPPADDPFALPQMPFEVEVRRLALRRVTLGEPVLGTPAALAITASTTLDEAGLQAALEVSRLDGTPGRVALDLGWQPAVDRLRLDLVVAEPRGGLLARLLAIEGLPAIDLAIAGEGPLSDWRGELDLALDGQRVADLTLSIDGRERRRLALQGRIEQTPLLPADAQPWLAGGAAIHGAGTMTGDLLVIEEFRLDSAGLALALAGSLEPAAETLDLTLDAQLLDPALLAPYLPDARLDGAAVTATLQGSFAAPTVAAEATLERPALPEFAAERLWLSLAAEPLGAEALAVEGYDVDLEALLTDPSHALPELPPWDWGDARLTARGSLTPLGELDLREARLRGRDLDLDLAGALDLQRLAGTLQARLQARVPPIPDVTAVPLGLALSGEVTLAEDGGGATRLDSTVTGTDALPEELGALLGPEVRLAGAAALAGDGTLTFDDLALRATGAELRVDGSYGEAGVDLTWQGQVADLAGLAPLGIAASGAADLQGTLRGPSLDELTLEARVSGRDLGYEQVVIGDLTAEAAVSGLPAAPRGRIALAAPATDYGPLQVEAEVTPQEDGGYRLEPLTLAWGDALALAGALRSAPAGLPLAGQLTGKLSGSPLLEELGLPLQGGGNLAIELSAGAAGEQDARVRLTLAPGRLADIAHGGGTLNATLRDLLGSPRLEADASFAAVDADPARLETLRVTARGALDKLAVSAAATGDLDGELALNLSGEVQSTADGTRIALAPFQGTVAGLPLALARPATVTLAGGTTRIAGATFTLGGGSVTLDATLGGGAPRLELAVAGLDLGSFERFYRETVPQGVIDLTLSLQGSGRGTRGTITLQATQLAVRERGLAVGPAVAIQAQGTLAAGRLDLQAALAGDFRRELALSLSMPLIVALDRYSVEVPADEALEARADWDGRAENLVDFLPFDNQILTGAVHLDLAVGGTVAQPAVSGGLRLTDGRYENLLSGTLLSNLDLTASGQGRRLQLEASANDGGQGRLTLSGYLDLGAADGVDADLRLALASFALLQRDDLFARVQGELALADRGQGLELFGSVTGERVDYDIGARLPPSVATLDVVVLEGGRPVNPPDPEPPPGEETTAVAPFALPLDLTVNLPRRVYVRGSGLESEWAGTLTIAGTTARPVIRGSLQPQRGLFSLLGSEFALQGGAVTFDGGPSLDPILDLRAVHEGSSIRAIVSVGGRASAPEIALTSEPPLPQEEILSRVLFGRGTGQISPLEAVQLAEAAAILSGATGSDRTMVDRLRQSFGLDVLRLQGGEDSGDVSATLGQYLAPGLFLGLTGGTTPGSSGVTVEYEVSPEIVVEGKVGETTKVGVRWQWDY